MAISKRKAWRYLRPAAPKIRDLFSDAASRKMFVKYWIMDNISDVAYVFAHASLKFLSMDACSAFGAKIGLFTIPRYQKTAARRARATIATLMPDLSPEGQDQLFRANCEAQGRLLTEFSIINRLSRRRDRLSIHNICHLERSLEKGPVIIVGMHLGNWEIGPVILQEIALRPYANYIPPQGRAKAWIAQRVRTKAGLRFLIPGHQGAKQAAGILNDGGVISMFCDEGFRGVIRGPFFGRPMHLEGNLAVAVRLAHLTGATICPWYNLRGDGFRFTCNFLEPISFVKGRPSATQLESEIRSLNDTIEPIVKANLDQWYFVDHRLDATSA